MRIKQRETDKIDVFENRILLSIFVGETQAALVFFFQRANKETGFSSIRNNVLAEELLESLLYDEKKCLWLQSKSQFIIFFLEKPEFDM